MSLWTPSGEHRVESDRSTSEPAPSAGQQPEGGADAPSMEDLTPEQRAQVEEMNRQMEEARAKMLEAPSGAVIGQQALQFYELAALYLSQDPPRVDDARKAIDALSAVIEALGDRLDEAHDPLQQAVNQIQLAFVEVSNQAGTD